MTRRWRYRRAPGDDAAPTPPDRSTVFDRLLRVRGLTEADAVERFCQPRLTHLHAPDGLADVDRAAERLCRAIRDGETVAIYGDYDVDGITGTSILHHALKAADPHARLRTFVPHRLEEGYGLNVEAIGQLVADGARVIVSVDCGIRAVDPARVAKSLGADLIITDHHNPPKREADLPDAYAIVHPRRPGAPSPYPFGELAGAGVAYKLAWRFATLWCGSDRVSKTFQRVLLDLLPLAALGTIADVVPLVDENRTLASYGLRLMRETPFEGLNALIRASGLDGGRIDAEKVGFILGPRLNACGRMGHAAEAIRLLTEAEPDEAMEIAERLARLNEERQRTERAIFQRACELAEAAEMTSPSRRIVVLADADWHPGVVGIVCSRLVERYGRPAVLMQRSNGVCKGSARSIEGYSIAGALEACSDLLLAHGGHDMAAGVALRSERLEEFQAAMVEHANERIAPEELTPVLHLDVDANVGELTFDVVRRIEELSPFGRGNPKPVVRLRDVRVAQRPRVIGQHGRHLQVFLEQETARGRGGLRAVWWGAGPRAEEFAPGARYDFAVEPKLNSWRGRVNVEGEIRDARRLPGDS